MREKLSVLVWQGPEDIGLQLLELDSLPLTRVVGNSSETLADEEGMEGTVDRILQHGSGEVPYKKVGYTYV